MLSAKEELICERYAKVDSTGHVHCFECPLNLIGKPIDCEPEIACKATHHYDRKKKMWCIDD